MMLRVFHLTFGVNVPNEDVTDIIVSRFWFELLTRSIDVTDVRVVVSTASVVEEATVSKRSIVDGVKGRLGRTCRNIRIRADCDNFVGAINAFQQFWQRYSTYF